VQVTVPLTLTLTVPDQFTAALFHTSAAKPPYPSPLNPRAFATRADAAALALSGLARAGAFHDIPMPNLAANLKLSRLTYPVVTDSNLTMIFTETSENFTAVRSPEVNTLQESLLAFAEATAFELDVALQSLPELAGAIDVRSSVVSACLFIVRSQKH
jgi:hypothetical protein